MKTIITEYLGVFMAVVIGIAVISLIICVPGKNGGILSLGQLVMNGQTEDKLQYYENVSYDSFLRQNVLHISYVEENPIYAQNLVKLLEHFTVTDEEGNNVPYEVGDIYDKDGNSCYHQVVTSIGNIQFKMPGIYRILIQTEGKNTKNVSALITFPVKAREEGSRG